MPKLREAGYRTSIMVPPDVDKLLSRGRDHYKKTYGYKPSRSAMITMALRGFFKQPDWIGTLVVKGSVNGQ